MVEARSLFVQLSWKVLANATTVAVRYSAVRRQFARRDKGAGAGAGAGAAPAEVQVLDYLTQQYKLLPLVATTFALFFTGTSCACARALSCSCSAHVVDPSIPT